MRTSQRASPLISARKSVARVCVEFFGEAGVMLLSRAQEKLVGFVVSVLLFEGPRFRAAKMVPLGLM